MSRRKARKQDSGSFGRLLKWTIVLSLVFSAGLVTGQRLLHHSAVPPLVTVGPALSTTGKLQAGAGEDADADPPEQRRATFSFYDELAEPAPKKAPAPKPIEKRSILQKRTDRAPKASPASSPEKTAEPKDDPDPAPQAEAAPTEDAPLPARYTLQVGAHPTMERARIEVDRLRKIGMDAHVIVADVPGQGKFYRVRIGKFRSMDEARHFQASIKQRNSLDTLVTPL